MFTCKPFHFGFFLLSLLSVQLLTACGTSKAEVKDYTATSCSNRDSVKLNRNVVSLASGYFMFNRASRQPDFAQVDLNGKYASGQTEVLSDTLRSEIVEILRYNDLSSYNVKVISLAEMPESVEKNQTLKFSRPCQVNNALLDNEQLRSEPFQGTFYLLASKKNLMILRDGYFYGAEPITPLKFKLLNPETNQVEEITFSLHDFVNGSFIKAAAIHWGGSEEIDKSKKWRINKHTQTINDEKYTYFTLTKGSSGAPIVGEIQSIEFVLAEKD